MEILELYTTHTYDMYAWSHPCPWTAWVRHGTMGLKCVNVPRIMRVDAPSFRTGPATNRFVGKVY
jgi:hypothetical protein